MDAPAVVTALEYDPNRTAFIALIEYKDTVDGKPGNKKQYVIAPQNLKVGDEIVFSETAPLTVGNRTKLKNIPVGSAVYNVEFQTGKGG